MGVGGGPLNTISHEDPRRDQNPPRVGARVKSPGIILNLHMYSFATDLRSLVARIETHSKYRFCTTAKNVYFVMYKVMK